MSLPKPTKKQPFFTLPDVSDEESRYIFNPIFSDNRLRQFNIESVCSGQSSDVDDLRDNTECIPSFTSCGNHASNSTLSMASKGGDSTKNDEVSSHWTDERCQSMLTCCNWLETSLCNVNGSDIPGLQDFPLAAESTLLLCGRDVKNFIIGIPSPSFSIEMNCHNPTLKLLLPFLHNEKIDKDIAILFQMCKSFLNVKRLSLEFRTSPPAGSLMKAVSSGIEEYLYCYETNILSVEIEGEHPIDAFLVCFSGVWAHLRSFHEICEVMSDLRKKLLVGVPNGCENIQFLSSVYDLVGMTSYDPLSTGMNLIIKRCFGLYFSFIRHWLFDGIVDNDSFEFCLKTDAKFSYARDETFWTKYFCDDMNDNSVPCFLKHLRRDIFICGKSFSLLRSSCNSNVLFSIGKDLPEFMVGFSQKKNEEIEKGILKIMITRLSVLSQNLEKFITDGLRCHDRRNWWKETIMHIGVNKELQDSLLLKLPDDYRLFIKEKVLTPMTVPRSQYEEFPSFQIRTIEDTLQSKKGAEHFSISHFGKPLDAWIEKYPTRDALINRLIVRIAKCLDNSCPEIQDGVLFLQDNIIQMAISQPITALATAQIEIVNRCTLQYLLADRKLYIYLEEIVDLFFFREPDFRKNFSHEIFLEVDAVETPELFFSPHLLHSLLAKVLPNFCNNYHADIRLQSHLSTNVFPRHRLDIVNYLRLSYHVEFPCNIIITDSQLEDYNKVMRFFLKLELPFSYMKHMWFSLKVLRNENREICDSTQYMAILQFRNEMYHFVGTMHSFVSYMILTVEWTTLMMSIRKKVKNLEDLRQVHLAFIQNAVKICLLTPSDHVLQVLVQKSLNCILKFNKYVKEGEWYYNNTSCEWQHNKFENILRNFRCFMVHVKTLQQALMEFSPKSYLALPLETLAMYFNFNHHYDVIKLMAKFD